MATDYDAWIGRHSSAFGLNKPEDLSMLVEWASVFAQHGYTVDELNAATSHMIGSDAPRYRTDHLVAIQRFILGKRMSARPPATDDSHPMGSCVTCDSIGLVIVPHPRFVHNLEWLEPFPTCAVTCSCALGVWKSGRINTTGDEKNKTARPPMLGLDGYKRIVPNWKTLVDDRATKQAAMSQAHGRAQGLDKMLGRLAERFKAKG